MSATDDNAIVIGGGIVGWATAFALSERGVPATVIDAAHPEAATLAGAGIVTLGTSQNLPDAYIELATAAIAFYPRLVSRLADLDAGETGYARVGALHVAFTDHEADGLPAVADRLRSRRAPDALERADIRIISGDEARELVPPLSPLIPAAVWYADAARVNGRLMRAALRCAALSAGCRELIGASRVRRTGNRLTVTMPDGSERDPDIVVVASGAWTAGLCGAIALPLSLVPQRGQIAHFDLYDASTASWPSVETESRFYMLTFPGGRVVSGATRELNWGFDPRLTAAGMHEVLTNALRIAPGLANATVAEFRVGLRPFSLDGRPFIGAIPGASNGFICAGHGPSGLTLGPYSGAVIADVATGSSPPVDLAPYRPDRPAPA
ncbi:MAG: FAD-binding oxidoreductase [Chloroflexota bacterium]|nr:FAD-binding oxidoreductase [Chloroflexota bacterium]